MVRLFSGSSADSKVLKTLDSERWISREQVKEAVAQSKKEDKFLSEVLFEREAASADKIVKVFSDAYEIPEIRLRDLVIAPVVLNLVPFEIAEQHSIIAFKKIRNVLQIATTTPENTQTVEFIQKQTGLEPELFVTSPEDIRFALRKYKSELATEFAQIIEQSTQEALAIHDTSEKMAHFVPIIKMVNTILERALLQRASDIHLEPFATKVIIRFRIDGLLSKIVELPKEVLPSLLARIKLMASLKIDEHRQPQDGRFKFTHDEREVAVRVSIVPTLNGATIVMRLLDASEKQFSLGKLGLNKKDTVTIRKEIQKPHGMILVTGPTGSGKTTTLYTILRMLNREDVNICTVEDPIEYGLEGINQTQISNEGGITFATGLRSLLRQDPNIIMVGEIRDTETANIALNAAMTGHLVLSTLHTNTAFLAPQRLIEMGVPNYLAASVINVIIGQRLVRKVCPNCIAGSSLTSKSFDAYRTLFDFPGTITTMQKQELLSAGQNADTIKLSYGKGCTKCNDTGYLGRVGIYEIVTIDEKLRATILAGESAEQIEKEARASGVLTMQEDGLLKALTGKTTLEEVVHATKE